MGVKIAALPDEILGVYNRGQAFGMLRLDAISAWEATADDERELSDELPIAQAWVPR